MKSFNVLRWEFNEEKPTPYDIIPYLIDCYNKSDKKPITFEGFKDFIKHESMYQWWSRCQYEIIIKEWPPRDKSYKLDVHEQVMMNIDIIANLLMEEVNENREQEISK